VTFEADLATLEAALHGAIRAAEVAPTCRVSQHRADAERQLHDARKVRVLLAKAVAVHAAGWDPSDVLERIPPEVRLHLPTPGSPEWPSKAMVTRWVACRVVARAD
jgi:hypothetical protein